MGACEDDSGGSSDLWWAGVLISIIASIASNLGVNVQKFALMREAKKAPADRRSYLLQPLWFGGLLLVIVGSLGDFVALGFAAQSLITPVGGFTMVANVFFAHMWLKEALTRKDLMGTGLVIVGVILIAGFADKRESCFTLDELVELYKEPPFAVYAVGIAGVGLGLYFLSKYIEKVYATHGAWSEQYARVKMVHKWLYPTLSGFLGAQSVLFAKSTAELVKATARGENQFDKVATYFIIISMFCTIFMQIHWLTVGLKWFDAVYVIPVFQCFFITVTILGGAVYFKELSSFSALQSIMFPIGVILTIAGIFMLSQRDMSAPLPRLRSRVFLVMFMNRINRAARRTAAVQGTLSRFSCLCTCHAFQDFKALGDSPHVWDAVGVPKPSPNTDSEGFSPLRDDEAPRPTSALAPSPSDAGTGAVLSVPSSDDDSSAKAAAPGASPTKPDEHAALVPPKLARPCTHCSCSGVTVAARVLLYASDASSLGLLCDGSVDPYADVTKLRSPGLRRRQLPPLMPVEPHRKASHPRLAPMDVSAAMLSTPGQVLSPVGGPPRALRPHSPPSIKVPPEVVLTVSRGPSAPAFGSKSPSCRRHSTPDPSSPKYRIEPRGTPRVTTPVPSAANSPTRFSPSRSPLARAGIPGVAPGHDIAGGELHREPSRRNVLLRAGSADEAVDSAITQEGLMNPPVPLFASPTSDGGGPTVPVVPYYERTWLTGALPDTTGEVSPMAASDVLSPLSQATVREVAALRAGGGTAHQPSGRNLVRAGSSHLHLRTRMQQPLAPLPTGVMVGAGLEAAAKLGRSILQRMFKSFHAGSNRTATQVSGSMSARGLDGRTSATVVPDLSEAAPAVEGGGVGVLSDDSDMESHVHVYSPHSAVLTPPSGATSI